MDGDTQRPCKAKSQDVLLRVPKSSYFRTRYREMPIPPAHSSEIETRKILCFKGKPLDFIGRLSLMLSENIKAIRKSKGLSQEELAVKHECGAANSL